MKATCPECAAEITLKPDTEQAEIITCECGMELEVTKVSGESATVAAAPEEDEDWGE